MDQDVHIILQHLVDLRGEIQQLRGETAQRFDRVEADIRQTNALVEDLRRENAERFDRVEADIRQTNVLVEDLRGETAQRFEDLRGETAQRFEDLRGETAQRFDDLRGETAQRFDDLREETAQRFEDLSGRTAERFDRVETDIRQTNVLVEDLRGQIRLVAEGVDNVNEKLDRFREEVAHEFEVVRAENRLHYADLDTRVRNLEVAGG